jgi:hypothetical protein
MKWSFLFFSAVVQKIPGPWYVKPTKIAAGHDLRRLHETKY